MSCTIGQAHPKRRLVLLICRLKDIDKVINISQHQLWEIRAIFWQRWHFDIKLQSAPFYQCNHNSYLIDCSLYLSKKSCPLLLCWAVTLLSNQIMRQWNQDHKSTISKGSNELPLNWQWTWRCSSRPLVERGQSTRELLLKIVQESASLSFKMVTLNPDSIFLSIDCFILTVLRPNQATVTIFRFSVMQLKRFVKKRTHPKPWLMISNSIQCKTNGVAGRSRQLGSSGTGQNWSVQSEVSSHYYSTHHYSCLVHHQGLGTLHWVHDLSIFVN